jgi:hypothetical protein
MKKILFICGSLNQTSMMHQISRFFDNYDCYFTPYYGDRFLNFLAKKGILDFCILGGNFRRNTENYLRHYNLKTDYRGLNNDYDLIFTCNDMLIPKNIRDKKIILVQEGMTDPENMLYYLVKYTGLPRWFAGTTSVTGISNLYSLFCVASPGYKELFIRKGCQAKKLVVTGIPNFDNVRQNVINDFPYKNYVLAATSDMRETFRYENRKRFINKCLEIAGGRQLIFKLHPNEKADRAIREINKYAPDALVFASGNTDQMIANCDVLITKYSTVVYVGMALGKEVYSEFDINELKKLLPLQNNGTSAERIARLGIYFLEEPNTTLDEIQETFDFKTA